MLELGKVKRGDESIVDLDLKSNMNMKISITQKAKDLLQKAKKLELYVERLVISECCVPLSTPPNVRKGRPCKPEDFYAYDVEGIIVYYDRNLINKAKLTIDAQGFGLFKGLYVSDWIIKY